MRPPTSRDALVRFLTVAAFGALLVSPIGPTGAVLFAVAAVAAVRVARVIAGVLGRVVARRLRNGPTSEGAIALGVDRRGRPVALPENDLAAHGLILGASGAGKTTTLLAILSHQIQRGRPVVAIDMKGSPAFVRVLAESAAAAGRPITVWTIDGGAHWNPLAHGNATELKDKLIATERFTEPHYQRAAERYIQTVLQVSDQAHPDRPPTLPEVVALMEPRRLAAALRNVDRPIRERVQDYLAGMTHDQLSAVRGLQTRLAVLTESHTGRFLAPPADAGARTIDLRAGLSEPGVVVFSLNSSRYGRLAAQIGTLAIQDLVAASGDRLYEPSRGRSIERAVIGIDEFSGLSSDHVAALLSRGRESGMPVLVATQELADLERAAAGLQDLVLGVTAVKIVHRQEVPRSALTIAQIAGTEMVWDKTYQTGGPLIAGFGGARGTRRQVERFVVDPNEIKSLPTGEAVVIAKLRGAKPRTVRITPPRRLPPELGR
ncbi:MAG TPA: helicase HerA-like domain-containing protein [Solirubrobacteraceae bacterium]|nr:helicase HerA-like domain-containing protein [Solirubrobacteraceae bacterium]